MGFHIFLYLRFINFKKSFDGVSRQYISKTLYARELSKLVHQAVYDGPKSHVLSRNEISENLKFCFLSRILFSLAIDGVLDVVLF